MGPTRRPARAVAVGLCLAFGLATAGCGDDGRVESIAERRSADTGTGTGTGTGTDQSSTTTVPVAVGSGQTLERSSIPAGSWEGQRFDVGRIVSLVNQGDAWALTFDRVQLVDATGSTQSGPTLEEEPVLAGTVDVRVTNNSTNVRQFFVEPDATVLRLPASWTCDQSATWEPTDLVTVATNGVGSLTTDSLTFNEDGWVSAIRLSQICA